MPPNRWIRAEFQFQFWSKIVEFKLKKMHIFKIKKKYCATIFIYPSNAIIEAWNITFHNRSSLNFEKPNAAHLNIAVEIGHSQTFINVSWLEKQSKSKRGLFLAKYFWKFVTFRVYRNAWRVFIFHLLLLLLWCLSSRVMSMLGNVSVSRVSFSSDVFMPEYSTTICFWAVFFFSCFTLSKFVCICWWADWLMVILVWPHTCMWAVKTSFVLLSSFFFRFVVGFFSVLFCFSSHPKSSNIKNWNTKWNAYA